MSSAPFLDGKDTMRARLLALAGAVTALALPLAAQAEGSSDAGSADAKAESTATAPAQPQTPPKDSIELAPPLVPLPMGNVPANPIAAPVDLPIAGAVIEAIQTPSSPDAWGGVQDPKGAQLSQRVASYDLKAKLDPKLHTVEGEETLRWLNRSAVPVKTLYFHLYLNAFEGPHSTWMTEKSENGVFRSGVETKKGEWGWIDVAKVEQGGKAATMSFVHPDGGPQTDRSVLRVDLPEAVAPNATVELHIVFHDQLPRVVARTGWFDSFHLVGQWFPKIGVLELPGERGATAPRWNVHEFHLNSEFYADFGSYDLEVTAPRSFMVGATGELQGAPREEGDQTVRKFHQDDIHDCVFFAYDKYAPPLTGTYRGEGSPQVTVEVYYPPELAQSGKDALQGTLDSLKYFSETLGPYPYRHLTVVLPPHNAGEAGGMEYETFFTTDGSNGIFGTLTRYVTVHEFGHGYFMGLLATNEFEEPYLDEGMNELWDVRMLEGEMGRLGHQWHGFGPPEFSWWDYERLTRGPRVFAPDPVVSSSWQRFSNGSYTSIYPRTVLIFGDLEKVLAPGAFAKGMKLYYSRWHHRHPSTADLREALLDGCDSEADKELVRRYFAALIYGTESVDDAIISIESEEVKPEPGTEIVDGGRVELDEEAIDKKEEADRKAFDEAHADAGTAKDEKKDCELHGKPGPYPFRSVVRAERRGFQTPQTLTVKFEDCSEQQIAWPVGEIWHRWVFDGPVRIASAQLDADGVRVLDVRKLDDGRARKESSLAPRRWTLEVAAWMQLFFSLAGSL